MLHFDLQLFTQMSVQRGEGLVQHQQLWLADQDARQRRALLLTARKLAGQPTLQPCQAQQLHHLVQRLLILGGEEEIGHEEVDTAIRGASSSVSSRAQDVSNVSLSLPLREAREQFERTYLIQQFRESEGNVARLAERVGMERTNLYRKLRALGIDPKKALDE